MSYDPHAVLQSVDRQLVPVMAFMTLCLVCTFTYLVTSFRTARLHRAYPAPLSAVGWFAIHDAYFVFQWDKWFGEYHHWWPEFWAVALIATSAIEFALCWQVYKYGREELMPRLTQTQFGAAIVAALIGIGVVWAVVKPLLDDDLCLIAFALTAWWPPVWTTLLIVKRQSLRGQSRTMIWALLGNPIGMFGAWYFLDPYFRSPLWLAFAVVTVLWSTFNVWLMGKYPDFVPARDGDVVSGHAVRQSGTSLEHA
jgi:hypothetical protein